MTDAPPSASRRDSAGIEIIANDESTWREGVGWTLASQPSVIIAFDERTRTGPSDVAGVVRLSNGDIVIASKQDVRLEQYDSTGRFVQIIGRRGDGPGEFRAIEQIWRTRGDSLLVFEGGMTRTFVKFDSQGHAGRRWQAFGPDSATHYLVPVAALEDGELVMRTMNVITPSADLRYERPATELVVFDSAWRLTRRLGEFPDVARYRGPARMQAEAFFAYDTRFAFGRSRWMAGDSERAEYREYSYDGRLVRIVRWRAQKVPITAAHIEREQQRRIAHVRRFYENMPSLQRRVIESGVEPLHEGMWTPTRFPEFADIQVARDGEVMLLDYPRIGEERSQRLGVTVFSPAGQLLGRVLLPLGFHPTEVGDDCILGVRTDEMDVSRVELWRVYGRSQRGDSSAGSVKSHLDPGRHGRAHRPTPVSTTAGPGRAG